MIGAGSASLSVGVSTGTGCTYLVVSNAPFLHILGSSNGSGSGTLLFSVDPNPGPTREGTIDVGGRAFVVKQAEGTAPRRPTRFDSDGAGKADVAIYQPGTGTWFITAADGSYASTQFGIGTDLAVPADYDGDGQANIAIYRPNTGTWYILAADGSYAATQFGIGTDIPVPGDYDGDGKTDIAIYRPNTACGT